MTVQRSYRYGDPAKVIEFEQERSCHLCMYKVRIFDTDFCATGKKGELRRCGLYKEREPDARITGNKP